MIGTNFLSHSWVHVHCSSQYTCDEEFTQNSLFEFALAILKVMNSESTFSCCDTGTTGKKDLEAWIASGFHDEICGQNSSFSAALIKEGLMQATLPPVPTVCSKPARTLRLNGKQCSCPQRLLLNGGSERLSS